MLERRKYSPAKEIRTSQGNVLRLFTPTDAHEIFSLIDRNREHLSQFDDTTAEKYPTEESVVESINHPKNPKRQRYAIRTANHTYVGTINFTPDENDQKSGEIGYYIGEEFGGHGYATDALIALTQSCLKAGITNPYALVFNENIASRKVLEKAGYQTDGVVDGENHVRFVLS